ncbi:bpX5 domain-containing protein [Kitasatospora sp. NPDC001660]
MTAVRLRWEPCEPPLPAAAVLALGEDVPALATATRDRLLTGTRLGVAADPGALLVLGATEDLPWVPGARYLGVDGELLVPTTARPQPAAALWRTALGAGDGQLCALVPGHALVADRPPLGTDPAALENAGATTVRSERRLP